VKVPAERTKKSSELLSDSVLMMVKDEDSQIVRSSQASLYAGSQGLGGGGGGRRTHRPGHLVACFISSHPVPSMMQRCTFQDVCTR
jgi:hypothetical protein